MFRKGELVNSGLQSFAEYGDTTGLDEEGQGHELIMDSFTSRPIERGYGTSEASFYSDANRSQVSCRYW